LEDLGVGGRLILNGSERIRIERCGLKWRSLGKSGGLLWTRFELHNMREISSLAVKSLTYHMDYSLKEVNDYGRFKIFYKCHK